MHSYGIVHVFEAKKEFVAKIFYLKESPGPVTIVYKVHPVAAQQTQQRRPAPAKFIWPSDPETQQTQQIQRTLHVPPAARKTQQTESEFPAASAKASLELHP